LQTVEWDELHFDVRLLQRVPYEGVSRMTTSLRRRHRDRVVRRGIGLTIESDFYATEAGRKHFKDQLTGIRYCVQETCNFDALFSYLTCANYDFRYDLQKGLRPRRSVRQAMAHEIMMYAIVQKDGRGLDKAVEDVKHRMGRYQVKPNLLIIPPQLSLYMSTAPEEMIKFSEGGEKAVTRFEEGADGFQARGFRGMAVVDSQPFEVSDDSESLQMLQRSSQVGEFYRMSYPPLGVGNSDENTKSKCMDIVIYDEEADQHKHITFEQALYATGIDDTDLTDPNKPFKLPAGTTKASLINKVKAGEDPKVSIVVVRPFIEHQMMSCVATVAGRETGATLFGPADMQISANTSVKTIEGHYTCHTKSIITNPKNVYVMRDVMCSGYVAGGNTRWFASTEEGKNKLPSFTDDSTVTENIRNNINSRLSFEDDASGEYGSMLAFLVPSKDDLGEFRDQVISITERLLPWEVARNATPVKQYFPGGDSFFQYYKNKYQLDSIHYGEDVRASESMAFISQGSCNNGLCFLGPHRVFNPFSANYFELRPGQGHFGPDAVPGDARWRRGEAVSLQSARNSMGMSVEAAAFNAPIFGKGRP